MMKATVNIFWFRRDLRLDDNAGLYQALAAGLPVVPIFIFDKDILEKLDADDRRVAFIHAAIQDLQQSLIKMGSTFEVYHQYPIDAFELLLEKYTVNAVFTNQDYEPYARERDEKVSQVLSQHHAVLHTYKDQVIFEKNEVVKPNKQPYTVYTPYSKVWLNKLNETDTRSYETQKLFHNFYKQPALTVPLLAALGFKEVSLQFPIKEVKDTVIQSYHDTRDFPYHINGTSRIGVHLRFGTVSIRRMVSLANQLNATFLNELIWREFYQAILWHFPHVVHHAFKPAYDNIQWRNNEVEFERWCEGTTGYPIVDAGMRQLNETGFMHNRIRMVTASFLTKHLLIDWRWGEAYFAQKLLDYELASNNGGWQWAAGSGCDAAPYFRIFNPYLQTKKFDPQFAYIRQWVPEFESANYPTPIVEHEFARKRALEVYSKALKERL
jgi:deoxyribodipyrimidine photo-lyase